MSVETVPAGGLQTCRFCFTLRELTPAEEATFLEGKGLPSGVGFDPATVIGEYRKPGAGIAEVSGGEVVKDGVGAYHIVLAIEQDGYWTWRGRGKNAEGKAVRTTPWQVIQATV